MKIIVNNDITIIEDIDPQLKSIIEKELIRFERQCNEDSFS